MRTVLLSAEGLETCHVNIGLTCLIQNKGKWRWAESLENAFERYNLPELFRLYHCFVFFFAFSVNCSCIHFMNKRYLFCRLLCEKVSPHFNFFVVVIQVLIVFWVKWLCLGLSSSSCTRSCCYSFGCCLCSDDFQIFLLTAFWILHCWALSGKYHCYYVLYSQILGFRLRQGEISQTNPLLRLWLELCWSPFSLWIQEGKDNEEDGWLIVLLLLYIPTVLEIILGHVFSCFLFTLLRFFMRWKTFLLFTPYAIKYPPPPFLSILNPQSICLWPH